MFMKSEKQKIIEKLVKVFKSCKTKEHKKAAQKYFILAARKIKLSGLDMTCIIHELEN